MNYPIGLFSSQTATDIPLKGVRLDARIRDLFCDVTIEQRYENAGRTNIEAVYTFPLPLDAVLLDVQVRLGEKCLRGTVVPKAEAEQQYERAIADGDAAVRLELVEPGLYSMNVGNLLAGETAVITLRYGQLLRWNGDAVRFHIPTTYAPRYGTPQMAPHQVPPVNALVEHRYRLGIHVSGLLARAALDCPTHRLSVKPAADAVELAFAAEENFMDRDFVLNFQSSEGQRSSAVSVPHGDGRVAMLSWRPSLPAATGSEAPRAFKIVIDCSGSMQGDSITQAGLALRGILQSLRPADVFDIVCFGDHHVALFGRLRPASGNYLVSAFELAVQLQAGLGGTKIGQALKATYAIKGDDKELRPDILLITDGEVAQTAPIIEAARASSHRIFTVGVGTSVAEAFVRELASATGGACELVSPNEDMAARIVRHFQRMNAVRASDARILWPGRPVREIPSRLPIVFDGDTVHAYAWLTGDADEVTIELTLADGNTVRHTLPIQRLAEANDSPAGHPLARMAAAAWINEAPEKATDIAVEYQLLTKHTDYIVVHQRAEGEKAVDLPNLKFVPHMLAAGWGGVGSVTRSASIPDKLYCLSAPTEMSLGDAGILCRKVVRSTVSDRESALKAHFFPSPESSGKSRGLDQMSIILASLLEFDATTGRLLRCELKSLREAGVEEQVLRELQQLIDSGHDEYQIILAWVIAVFRMTSANKLTVRTVQRVTNALKKLTLDQVATDQVTAYAAKYLAKTTVTPP